MFQAKIFNYTYQKKQIGIPDAINIAEKFIAKKPFILALADNLFIGKSFKSVLRQVQLTKSEAAVLAVKTKYPSKSAVIEFDKKKNIQSIIEKPKNPKSNLTIPGLYFYDHQSIPVIKKLKPSKRGELEIVDVHLHYLQRENLKVFPLNKDVKWFDTVSLEFDTLKHLLRAIIQSISGMFLKSEQPVYIIDASSWTAYIENYICERGWGGAQVTDYDTSDYTLELTMSMQSQFPFTVGLLCGMWERAHGRAYRLSMHQENDNFVVKIQSLLEYENQ